MNWGECVVDVRAASELNAKLNASQFGLGRGRIHEIYASVARLLATARRRQRTHTQHTQHRR